jgi:hypothetical protein
MAMNDPDSRRIDDQCSYATSLRPASVSRLECCGLERTDTLERVCTVFKAYFGDYLVGDGERVAEHAGKRLHDHFRNLAQILAALRVRPHLWEKVSYVPELRPLMDLKEWAATRLRT